MRHVEAISIIAFLIEIEGASNPINLAALFGYETEIFDHRVCVDFFLEIEGHNVGQDGIKIEIPTGLGLGHNSRRRQVRPPKIVLDRKVVAIEVDIHCKGEVALGNVAALLWIIKR